VFAIDADHERVTSVSWDDLVASVLARTARQADLAYVDPETRELVMILPDTTAPSARVVAERIRAAIQAATTFTASVAAGVAEWQGEESMDVLMTGAREKLRAAREAGHNRVA
jgi:PleD family two-component response regulator